MKKIKIKFLSFSILVDLHNTENAMQIWEACPIKSIINTWGNEIYFDTKINTNNNVAKVHVLLSKKSVVFFTPPNCCVSPPPKEEDNPPPFGF